MLKFVTATVWDKIKNNFKNHYSQDLSVQVKKLKIEWMKKEAFTLNVQSKIQGQMCNIYYWHKIQKCVYVFHDVKSLKLIHCCVLIY